MEINEKIHLLLGLRKFTPSKLRYLAGLSRPTMSRIMRGHVPSNDTLLKIASVLEVSPGYLSGGYSLPHHLTEEDVISLADFKNATYFKM